MSEQELNKKLAEWAGWELKPGSYRVWRHKNIVPLVDEYTYLNHRPNFTESLDACFEWLVPKLSCYKLDNLGSNKHHACVGAIALGQGAAYAETPALALCLAILKLIEKDIDEEVN